MDREELLRSPEYWMVKIQLDLYREIESYMKKTGINRKELAAQAGVSSAYISQVLAGEFDHRLSRLVGLSLLAGKIPIVKFINLETYIEEDRLK